jgi:hypothetical protein
MRIAVSLAFALAGMLVSCRSAASTPSVDGLVLEAVVADPHFSEWTQCGEARYALHPVSAPPAYENQKPFFFTSSELGSKTPDSLAPELLESLRQRNATERRLPRLRSRTRTTSDLPADRRVWFSFPGYDSTGSVAAVAVTRNSVGKCAAAGYIVVLRRAGAKWLVEHRPTEWVE